MKLLNADFYFLLCFEFLALFPYLNIICVTFVFSGLFDFVRVSFIYYFIYFLHRFFSILISLIFFIFSIFSIFFYSFIYLLTSRHFFNFVGNIFTALSSSRKNKKKESTSESQRWASQRIEMKSKLSWLLLAILPFFPLIYILSES